jgi:hypothetical protein
MNYQFSHQVLPELFFKDSDKFFEEMKSADNGNALFQQVKRAVHFTHQKPLQEFLKEVTLHLYNCPEFEACILQMPEPKEVTEPYFIALVKFSGKKNESDKYRCILLEASLDGNGNDIAYLCEWVRGKHILHKFETTIFSLKEFINTINTQTNNQNG